MDFLIEKVRDMLRQYDASGATYQEIREIIDLINASDPDGWFDSIEYFDNYLRYHGKRPY